MKAIGHLLIQIEENIFLDMGFQFLYGLSHTENNVLYTGNMTEADAVLALAGYLEG
jgi:hypothetical protein